jgi:exonuclease VII large subunit
MADETEAAEAAEPSTAELSGRIDGIESKLDLLINKLGGAKDQAHATAEQHTEERLDRPSSIAEEIRAQLARRDADAAKAASEQSHADRLAAVEATVTGMAEHTPEAPQRWIEKRMGWR